MARTARISRQAAHRQLVRRVAEGRLIREGRGRASRYRPVVSAPVGGLRFAFPSKGLSEETVWDAARHEAPSLSGLPDTVERIVRYALTELVNNAIDHSGGDRVEVIFRESGSDVVFDVLDDGIGAFKRLQEGLGLPDLLSALQELSKGKTTTAPDRHTGEGIFFTSKAADYFELESNGLVWKVDNRRKDHTVGPAPERRGTRARFEISRDKQGTLAGLFEEYAKDFEFSKTRIVVELFKMGDVFISRSEAKRLLANLDRFKEIILDFKGVKEIGQGFADEVFRVWQNDHLGILLRPVNMVPTVEFMVRRALKR